MGLLDLLDAINQTPAERRQARRVDQLRGAMSAASQARARERQLDALRAEASEAELRETIRAQDEQLAELYVAVGVLVQMLSEAGALDAEDYRWRVEATMENTAPEAPAAAAPAAPRPEPMVTCRNCQREIPRKDSEITARGILCERCALAASL